MASWNKKKIFTGLVVMLALASAAVFFALAFAGSLPVSPDLTVGGVRLHLYSILMALGIYTGYSVARAHATGRGIPEGVFDSLALALIVAGFIGAKIFYLLSANPRAIAEVFTLSELWSGGFAFYGSIIAGIVVFLFGWLYYRFNPWIILDALALGLQLGQAIGRLGNFFNQEAYGVPTSLPWKMYIDPERRMPGFEQASFYHPTFLYEAVFLIGIYFFLRYARHKVRPGVVFGLYAILSGLLRSGVEELRIDALTVGSLMISQLAAIVLVVVGLLILITRANVRKAS